MTAALPHLSHIRRLLPWAAAVTLATPALSAHAQASDENPLPEASESRLAVGLGVASRQLPYAGADRKTTALPLLYYENRWVKLAQHAFTPSQSVTAGLRLKYDGEGYEADDSPRLGGMADRKGGFWGGVMASWRNPVAQLSAEWAADLSGHSKGSKLQLQVDRRFGWGAAGFTPRVQAQWLDRKSVDYYYGVRPEEALPGRAAYAGQAAMLLEAGVRVDYALTARHAVFLDLSATRLPDEIKRSPIVERSNSSRVALGYLYRF